MRHSSTNPSRKTVALSAHLVLRGSVIKLASAQRPLLLTAARLRLPSLTKRCTLRKEMTIKRMTLRKNALAANAQSSSDVVWRTLVLALVLLTAGISARAQCPTATLAVKGKVENVPEGSKDIEVLVVLETANGKFSHVGTISDSAFNVDLPFDTQKTPYSPLGGHHCTNLPKSVTVKVSRANQT